MLSGYTLSEGGAGSLDQPAPLWGGRREVPVASIESFRVLYHFGLVFSETQNLLLLLLLLLRLLLLLLLLSVSEEASL